LSDALEGMAFVSLSLDAALNPLVLAVSHKDFERLYRRAGSKPTNNMLASPHNFVVLHIVETVIHRTVIPNQRWNYHYVQTLPDNELLLVGARSRYYRQDEYDLNAAVFASDGRLKREFLLGDGIGMVQTTARGDIWTGYFDEGVLGNNGWTQPVGEHGLIQWDSTGRQQYAYERGLRVITDCYALNVVSDDETWFYYYTHFPLVQLKNNREVDYWQSPVKWSHAFAVKWNYVLFCGSYENPYAAYLYQLDRNHVMKHIETFTFLEGEYGMVARGHRIVLRSGHQCYDVDLEDLIMNL
jgi:hypothetical protein